MKKKTILSIIFTIFIFSILLCSCFGNNDDNNVKVIRNDVGAEINGSFLDGTIFKSEAIDLTDPIGKALSQYIEKEEYDKDAPIFIYDLYIELNNEKIKPDGVVKVILPTTMDLSNYEVLHVLDNGEIERLNLTYSNGFVSFETSSFSYFILVSKKNSSIHTHTFSSEWTSDEVYHYHQATCSHIDEVSNKAEHTWNDGVITKEPTKDELGEKTYTCTICGKVKKESVDKITETHTVKVKAEPWNYGQIRNSDDEILYYSDGVKLSETIINLKAHCFPNYFFVGWYNTADNTLISKDVSYSLTVDKDIDIYAKFVYKTDVVELELSTSYAGFSFNEDNPVTIVSKNTINKPDPKAVYVTGIKAEGGIPIYFGEYSDTDSYNEYTIDDGGLDFNKPGTYTITYTYKKDPMVNATLKVKVVESSHEFIVKTFNKDLLTINYVYDGLESVKDIYPTDRFITVSVTLKTGQAFDGWYLMDEKGEITDTKVSNKRIYSFNMPNKDYRLCAVSKAGDYCSFKTTSGGKILDEDNNIFVPDYWRYEYYILPGSTKTLKAQALEGYKFAGWYRDDKMFSDSEVIEYKHEGIFDYVEARFIPEIKAIEVSAESANYAGFVNGVLQYAIGDSVPNYKDFNVYGILGDESKVYLSYTYYKVDDSNVDLTKVGKYTITYTYEYDESFIDTLTIEVMDASNINISFENSISYLSHKFNGKASFISLNDIVINDKRLVDLTCSTIKDKISYKWINKLNNEVINTNDNDVTINGVKVNNFGPENYKRTIGHEIVGPVVAGEYKFVLSYDGKEELSVDVTITKTSFKRITSSDEFRTNEGSSWINFELYYYTIVGVVGDELYIMEMPSIGVDNVEVEARLVIKEANGNLNLGEGFDFIFANVKYLFGEDSTYTEFMTGYYGSYVDKSSNSSSTGLFGTPYIYRTGYTSVSGGNIYRQYGNKIVYGNKTEFAGDGSVKIYCPNRSETINDSLRLVKDNDKYVFTSVPADTDNRQSYPIYIYQSILEK